MIFNNSFLSIDAYICKTYSDVSLWTSQLSDRERICTTNEENDYIQNASTVHEQIDIVEREMI